MQLVPLLSRSGEIRAHAMVDDEDFEDLSLYTWRLHSAGYACRGGRRGELTLMHRQIMGLEDPRYVDHVNRNRLDNRRENLRWVTPAENNHNQPGRPGASLHRNVYWRKDKQRWMAGVTVGGRMTKSYWKTEAEAIAAAEQLRQQLMPMA